MADKKALLTQCILDRLVRIESKVDRLAGLMRQCRPSHTARMPTLLTGWNQISAYVKKGPRTLRRYAKNMLFPGIRFGRHVVSSPYLIDSWLQAVHNVRMQQRRSEFSQSDIEA